MNTGRLLVDTVVSHPCQWMPGRYYSKELLVRADAATPASEQDLVDRNFTRIGGTYLRAGCRDCQRCRGIRINARYLQISRSVRRRLRLLGGLLQSWASPGLTAEREGLLGRHYASRFNEPPQASGRRNFLGCAGGMHGVLELRNPAGHLIAMSAVSRLVVGLVSLDAAWDPDFARIGPGHLLLLAEMEEVRRLDLTWLYLGATVLDHPDWAYKEAYAPCELWHADGDWRPHGRATEILERACAS